MKTLRVVSTTLSIATALVASLALGTLNEVRGAVSYSTVGSTYSQTFDSLPNTPENLSLGTTAGGFGWTDDNAAPPVNQFSILGWYLYHPISSTEGGANGNQRVRIGAGTATTGSFWSFGSSGSTERALGSLGASTLAPEIPSTPDGGNFYIALRLRNDTGVTLERFTLSYAGEQWHTGTGTPETMTFGWSTTATSVNDPSTLFTAVPTLGWTAPVYTGAEGAVNGNANQVLVGPVTVAGFNWAPGTDLWLRWADRQTPGFRDDGMALDGLSFFAEVPEPSTVALLGLGLAAFLARRRR